MNARELETFTQILTSVCVLYGKPVSEMLIELYWAALQCFTLQEVKAAFQTHITSADTGQFMPKPADVVNILRGNSQTQALQAWSKVTQAIQQVGMYESIVFDDALIHAVIEEMGGWVKLCQTSLKELPFRATEFEKRYTAYRYHPPLRYPHQLVGLHEAKNRLQGYPVKPPLLFGQKQLALDVLQAGSLAPVSVHELTASPIAPSLSPEDITESLLKNFSIRERERTHHF